MSPREVDSERSSGTKVVVEALMKKEDERRRVWEPTPPMLGLGLELLTKT